MGNKELRDIEIARLAFIGASISALGDGISLLAAAQALDALEQDYKNTNIDSSTESRKRKLDYYINELILIKNFLNE